MSSKTTIENKKGNIKETMIKEIIGQLSKTLPSLKLELGEKKFDNRIKKAAKLLCDGIKSVDHKKVTSAKTIPTKSIVKKEQSTVNADKAITPKKNGSTKATKNKTTLTKKKAASTGKKITSASSK